MNHLDEMNLAHSFYEVNAPEVINPILNKDKPYVEQLVTCQCYKQYRVYVNGEHPISDTEMIGILCPHCGISASEFRSVSGHSAGCFNATMSRTGAVKLD